MAEQTKQPAALFDDALDDLDDFKAEKPTKKKAGVDKKTVRAVAEEQGFSSRDSRTETKPVESTTSANRGRPKKKEPTGAINFRAKLTVLDDFRNFGETQEPEWSLGYTLERAIAALKKELDA